LKILTSKKITLLFLLFIFFILYILYSSEIFSIQAGVFSSKKNSQNLVDTLKNHGIKCIYFEAEGPYKVNCGEFSQEADVYALKEELAEDSPAKQSPHEMTDEKPSSPSQEEFTPQTPILLDRVVAVVNKEVITWSELYKVMEFEATEQMKNLNEEERIKIFKESEPVFLETLIDMRLQLQEAKALGIGVTQEEIEETIENIRKKYSMTDTDFRESIKKEGFTIEEYKKRLFEQILINKVVQHEIRNKVIVSDSDVKKYMETHKEIFSGGEKYRLRQIFFKGPEGNRDKRAIEEKALFVIQKLKAGEDFSELAREYSEDPSGSLGGDLGFIEKDLLAKEFLDVLSGMKEGTYSMPFWTGKGLHIIKLDEKISTQNMDNVREDIRKQLAEEKFLESYKSWIKGLRERAYIEIRL
jgi:peptidyl-prolyl cis-trans isomerase SurA